MSDVFQSANSLASTLLERWTELGSRTASKVDAGVYGPSHAADDATAGANLVAESAWMWAAWTWETFAALAGLEGEPNIAESQPFPAPEGAELELAGPLARGRGLEQLPVGCVTILPQELGPGETKFKLRADATGYCGGTYVGEVKVTVNGTAEPPVHVWISVQ
jgi:hypothetical protein